MPGLRTPDTDLRLAAGAPFPEVPRVPTWTGPAEGPSVSDLRVQPPQVPYRENETSAARRKALRAWMRQKIPPHPPDHHANSCGVEGPTGRRSRRASSRRAGSGAPAGGSTIRQDVVAPSHSILTSPVIDAILKSRKFNPTARLERT